MKKLVSILLVLCMFVPLVLTASAVDTADSIHCEVLFSHESEDGTVEELALVGDALYFYLDRQEIRKCIAYNRSTGYLDYVEYEVGSDSFRRSQKTVSQTLTGEDLQEYAYTEPTEVLQSTPVSSVLHVLPEADSVASISADERQEILDEAYSHNYPREYTDHNTRPYIVGSVAVIMKDSLVYKTTEKKAYGAAAKTALSILFTILGFPQDIILAIASFAQTVDGVYELVEYTLFKKAKLELYRYKRAYINGTSYSDTWYREVSTAFLGRATDMGVILRRESGEDAYEIDYYDERKVAEVAVYYYEHGLGPHTTIY